MHTGNLTRKENRNFISRLMLILFSCSIIMSCMTYGVQEESFVIEETFLAEFTKSQQEISEWAQEETEEILQKRKESADAEEESSNEFEKPQQVISEWAQEEALPVSKMEISVENEELYEEISSKYEACRKILEEINAVYTSNNSDKVSKAYSLLAESKLILDENPESFVEYREEYEELFMSLEKYEKMINSIISKLESHNPSKTMDMSIPIGFTEEEFTYLLVNARRSNGKLIISDAELAKALAKGITEVASEKPINELFSLSIMSLETGWFKHFANTNNFGGLKGSKGWLSFATQEEGIKKTAECQYKNLKGNNTAREVGASYAPPSDGNSRWVGDVLSIMKTYTNSFIPA